MEVIQEASPDIIAVQELYSDQVKDLLPQLSETYDFYAKEEQEGELNGFFYRKERFQVLEKKNAPMSSPLDTLTMLTLKDQKTGKAFSIFNTHLSFSKIEKRDFQARFIVEFLEKHAKELPVILTGDLNTFPNRPDLGALPFYDGDYIHRILTKNSLRDARELSILGHLGPISTFTNSPEDVAPFKGTGTPGIFLDHIYVSKGIDVLIHAVQPGTVDGNFPSDHMPIIMDYLLNLN